MDPLSPLALYQPTVQQLEVLAVDDNGAVTDVWKEHVNLSWRRHPVTISAVMAPGTPLGGAFFEPLQMLSVFGVALPQGASDRSQGVLSMVSKVANGPWDGPQQISPSGAPRFQAGTPVAACPYPPHGTLEVVAAGSDGAVWVIWMSASDAWRTAPIADPGFTKAGQPAASTYYPDQGTLEALMVDAYGGVNVLWKSATVAWRHVGITPPGIAVDGTHIALAYYDGYSQLEGFLVDKQGRVLVLWKSASTPWQWVPLTDPGFAPAGAPIAAVLNAPHDQLEIFTVGSDGAIWLLWKKNNAPWNPPQRLSEAGMFAPKSPVTAAHFPPTDQLEVIVGDSLHFAREMTKYENRKWRPCALPIAPRSGINVVPDAQTSRLMQLTGSDEFAAQGMIGVDLGANTTHKGTHFVFFGDVPRGNRNTGPGQDADAVAYATYMDQGTVALKLITGGDGLFAPFRVKFAPGTMGAAHGQSTVMELGNTQTPTGAFSYGDYVYVFIVVHDIGGPKDGKSVSYLVRNTDPFNGQPYEQVFRFSEGNFWQVSPWVVPPLPELPRHSEDGVVLLGSGFTNLQSDGVYLAWAPLTQDGPRRDQIQYFAGLGPSPWSNQEAAAKPLWLRKQGYSSISLAHIDGANKWIALYSYAINDPFYREQSPVVARVTENLTDWPVKEYVVFDPCRDGAYGNFMHWPDVDNLHLGGLPNDDVPAWAYGPFIVAPLTRWHPVEREVTIHYLMSTHRPYQVQLMRSRFKID